MTLKAIKGILLYILIIIGIIIACGLLAIILMVIFPNLKLFGYGVVYRNKQYDAVVVNSSYSTYNLTLNTDAYDIVIEKGETNKVTYYYVDDVIGLANSELTKLTAKIQTNNIMLTVNEPSGFVLYKRSRLVVIVPESVSINLTLKSTKGDIVVKNCNVLSVNVTTDIGDFIIVHDTATALNLSSLNLNSASATFDFSAFESVEVASKTVIAATRGDFIFQTLVSDVEVMGEDIAIKANAILTKSLGLTFFSNNGWFRVGTLNSTGKQNAIISDNCLIEIGNLYGNTRIKSTNGNITVGNVFGNSVLETENGNITVTSAKENLRAENRHGSIVVHEYFKVGRFKSVKGNITVKSVSEKNLEYFTDIENVDGSIDLINNINKVNIIASGRSNVHVKFNKIIDSPIEHNIDATSGYISVWVNPNSSHFRISVTGSSVVGNIGSLLMFSSDELREYPENYGGNFETVCKMFVRGGTVRFYDYDI